MGLIHILDTEVSNKIAAGEVVEKPLSIVKELVENSIDAGATVITIDIRDGGISYIRVADNGSGMSEEDAKVCFLRHATSKIKNSSDLDAIYTLGFRGEALSSIGAVSKVKLYTKRRHDSVGVCVTCEGGEILSSKESGAVDGTVIEVTDLFYNTPARLKFLKKPATEGSHILDIVSRYVFAHPEISFKLIRDGKEAMFSSGDNNIINAVYAVYGKDYAKNMLPVNYEYNSIRVEGVIGKGTLSRANRNYETFLVNNRYIKSGLLISALEEAYKNQIMIAKFPTAILNIKVGAELVDINVHPTKLECKFSNEQEIYGAVYHAVKSALYTLPDVPEIEKPQIQQQQPQPAFEQKSLEDLYREKIKGSERRQNELQMQSYASAAPANEAKPANEVAPEPESMSAPEKPAKKDPFYFLEKAIERAETQNKKGDDWLGVKTPGYESVSMQTSQKDLDSNIFRGENFTVIGQVFDTYILVEKDDNLLLIDQHAAHERLNYEALKAEFENQGVFSQAILEPITVKLDMAEMEVFENNEDTFLKLGFGLEKNGDDTLIMTSVPGDISWSDAEPLLLELLYQMLGMRNDVISDKKQRLLYTISCKAAIKANMKISDVEMRALVLKVFNLENINTCPHGRPIVIRMTKKEIEKEFKRIV